MIASNKTSLISSYTYNLTSPGCHPGADTRVLHLSLQDDISEILPYLNAEIEEAQYDHKARVLVWKGKEKKYAFRSFEITVSPVREQGQVEEFCREAVELVNDVWKRREGIEPDYTRIEPPTLMEIYKKLPRTNCRECGFATCMAFAGAMRDNPGLRAQCPHL